jgi:hypothetical protein
MRVRGVFILTVASAFACTRPCFAVDNLAAQERLGVRVGYVETYDALYSYYGPGWDLTLYFNERLYNRLYLDLHVGATYLGDLLDPNLDDELVDPGDLDPTDFESELRLFYFSVGAIYGIPIGSTPYTITLSAAAGVYSVSVAFASDINAEDLSDQYFGGNGGIGLAWRLATSWSLELNGTVHYFATSEGIDDLLWWFTEGNAQDPHLLEVSLGLVMDLR